MTKEYRIDVPSYSSFHVIEILAQMVVSFVEIIVGALGLSTPVK